MPLFRKQSAAEVTSLAPHDSKARLLSGRDSQGFMAKPCTPHLIAQRVQPGRPLAPPAGAGAIPNPPQRKQNSPAPGPKPGGGAGAEGRAAAEARRPKAAGASPPTLVARAERRGRGRRRGRRLRRRPTAARTGQGRLTTDDAPAAGHGRRRPAGTGGRSGTPQRARRLLPPADAAICEAGAAGAVKGQSR